MGHEWSSTPAASQRPPVTEVRHGRFWLGLVIGLLAPPILFFAGIPLGGASPLVLNAFLVAVGLALKIPDEHRRTGDGILCGFAPWFLFFCVWFFWWIWR